MKKEIKNYSKIKFLAFFYLPIFLFLFLFLISLINASIDNNKVIISKEDFWFDRITKYVGTSKLIKLVANEDLHNIVDDIENPYEGNQEAIKEGKKHYVLKGCAALHCHGPKGKGSGGPALNKGVFNHSDGSTYSLAYIITNGIAGTKMGAYGSTLKEDEILKLIAYIRAVTKKWDNYGRKNAF